MAAKKEIKEIYSSLKNEINHHNFLYHNKDQPEITDNEYDQLFQELLKLENDYVFLDKSDSPTSRVGDTPQSDFCLLYTSPSPRDQEASRMPSSA